MTTPNGAIVFYNAGGSDSLASGLGPSTAVNGSTGSCSSGSAVVTGIDTTGVNSGDLFYGATSSGRKFSIVATVDSGSQVTLDDTLGATHSGDLVWAIGGKRKTLDHADSRRVLVEDVHAGWTIEFEDAQSVSSAFAITVDGGTNGAITLRGASGVQPVLTMTGTGSLFNMQSDGWCFEDFDLENTNATPGAAFSSTDHTANQGYTLKNLRAISATNEFSSFISTGGDGEWRVRNCEIAYCSSYGIYLNDTAASLRAEYTVIRNCGNNGIHGASFGIIKVTSCIVRDNTGDGIAAPSDVVDTVEGCILWGNTGDGIDCGRVKSVQRNIIAMNGGVGVRLSDSSGTQQAAGSNVQNNAFYSNTGGRSSGANLGDYIDLTADPFVDSANDDYNINNNAGGGATLRAATLTMPG